jgi:hypothetical protein
MPRPPLPGGSIRSQVRAGQGALVQVELTAEQTALLDERRGTMGRAPFLRGLLLNAPPPYARPPEPDAA